MIAATIDWRVLTVAAVLLLVAMVLLFRLLSRDPDVRRTRYGFFIERDRFADDEPPWPEFQPPAERTLPQWPERPTEELPPNQKEKP